MSTFRKAQRSNVFIKLAITGPTGSGKTFSALRLATGLIDGSEKRLAFIDTENDSASLYSEQFDFDVLPVSRPFNDSKFIEGIEMAVSEGYGCVVIDSASHFWEGILEYKSKLDSRGGNSYTNWNEAGKKFDAIISAVLQSKINLIACMRSKMDYILEDNGKGKMAPKKVGLAPVMRDGIEYEFTTVFDVSLDHQAQASKDRSSLFTDKIFQITEETGRSIRQWLSEAKELPPPEPEPPKIESGDWNGVTIKDVTEKKFGKGESESVAYFVNFEDGRSCGTLNDKFAELAHSMVGKKCDFITKDGRKSGTFELVGFDESDEIPMN